MCMKSNRLATTHTHVHVHVHGLAERTQALQVEMSHFCESWLDGRCLIKAQYAISKKKVCSEPFTQQCICEVFAKMAF